MDKKSKLEEIKKQVRKPRKIYLDKLIKYIDEIAQEFNFIHVAILKALKKLGITWKKTTSYKEKCPIKVKKYLNEIKKTYQKVILYILIKHVFNMIF